MRVAILAVTAFATLAACGSSSADDAAPVNNVPSDTAVDTVTDNSVADEQAFPDVIDATAQREGGTWTISATLSSPYDTPERYADAWRVVGPDGDVYGERILTHDHASEQPFTRSESGIEIPEDLSEVTIEGRDLANGYGGDTFVLTLDR
jgi:hypothetical protein